MSKKMVRILIVKLGGGVSALVGGSQTRGGDDVELGGRRVSLWERVKLGGRGESSPKGGSHLTLFVTISTYTLEHKNVF